MPKPILGDSEGQTTLSDFASNAETMAVVMAVLLLTMIQLMFWMAMTAYGYWVSR